MNNENNAEITKYKLDGDILYISHDNLKRQTSE